MSAPTKAQRREQVPIIGVLRATIAAIITHGCEASGTQMALGL